MMASISQPSRVLNRELGVVGATFMGLGSILGTGVFVSLAIAAGVTGPSVILATVLAAVVAACNALSSAQLAAAHPVSGGTYEYGYRYLSPPFGFTAGWMFVCAKTASAATAALGFAGYVLNFAGAGYGEFDVLLATGAVVVLSAISAAGVKESNRVNTGIVVTTLASLAAFVIAVWPSAWNSAPSNLFPFFQSQTNPGSSPLANLLHATALMFVAYAGYGRIATLGEEVRDPKRAIPRAIIASLAVSALLYITVAIAGIGAAGADGLQKNISAAAAPLEIVARDHGLPGSHWVVAVGAIAAMLGVLLNLVLGLSRVLLAMARRGDAPGILVTINKAGSAPHVAVWTTGAAIALLAITGNVKTTWSFSAFTILVYYAITNLAVLRLPPEERLYSRLWPWGGLASSLFLAFWVEYKIWIVGLVIIAAGLLWHAVAFRIRGSIVDIQ